MGDPAIVGGTTSARSPKSPKTASSPAAASPATGEDLLVADENADEDLEDGDSTYGADGGSDTTSLKSSILKYRMENGRTYHAYKDGYVQHNIFLLSFGGLHVAKLDKEPQRVLDAGCGTGIWSVEFGHWCRSEPYSAILVRSAAKV
ncbi:hypothetical protein jhhlp_008499 [Lomentospora prolificans]|uniref:Methyltransferase domain-containing protein n=1 Tax=Lomentospora prolificans TaxID=41688 RepID=A0A2N3MY83_9PEZI|nr:hypothetical protein jhhlp_008499 [Lomentospora prolificans]